MTEQEHLEQIVRRLEAPITPILLTRLCKQARLIHSILGMVTELGELADVVKKYIFYGKEIDVVNLEEEFGDMYFYMILGIDEIALTVRQVRESNGIKLIKRFGDRFSEEKAQHRDLEGERDVLETVGESRQFDNLVHLAEALKGVSKAIQEGEDETTKGSQNS